MSWRKIPADFTDLKPEVERIERILEPVGASYRGCNREQYGYSRSSEMDEPETKTVSDEENYIPELDDNGRLVLPDSKLSADKRLEILCGSMDGCLRCRLGPRRESVSGKLVFGSGSANAKLMLIGEAPGFEEERSGEPFVGPAGKMLDRILDKIIGMSRADVYVVNVLKCRPESNRDPEPSEMEACRPFLDGQIGIVGPDVIMTVGAVATRALMGIPGGIHTLRGRWMAYRGIPVKATFHPSYLLRLQDSGSGPGGSSKERVEKKRVAKDFLEVKDAMGRRGYRQRLVNMHGKS